MALPVDSVGSVIPARTTTIDRERAKAYALATNDDNPAYLEGRLAPPVFGVVPTWEVVTEAVARVVPADALMFVVHGEQDMHFHQPLVPGAELTTAGEVHSLRVGSSGTRLTVKLTSEDAEGRPVLTQYNTIFVRGVSDGESGGPDKPGHDFPSDARVQKVGEMTIHVDDDQTFRYRDASGDEMPIHLDEDFAKSVGLPGIIVHGLCTMAMCSQAVVKEVAGGDPARLRRLAVRFAANLFPGQDLLTEIYEVGEHEGTRAYAFEASSAGAVVIKNGRAEVAPA